jgi:hypothetical protein
MYLVQLLLPLLDNENHPFPGSEFDRVRNELTERFGGATAFLRSPASGVWKEDNGETTQDEIVIFEAMDDDLDRDWWRNYRAELERRFRQDEVVVRALAFEPL